MTLLDMTLETTSSLLSDVTFTASLGRQNLWSCTIGRFAHFVFEDLQLITNFGHRVFKDVESLNIEVVRYYKRQQLFCKKMRQIITKHLLKPRVQGRIITPKLLKS